MDLAETRDTERKLLHFRGFYFIHYITFLNQQFFLTAVLPLQFDKSTKESVTFEGSGLLDSMEEVELPANSNFLQIALLSNKKTILDRTIDFLAIEFNKQLLSKVLMNRNAAGETTL